MLTEKEWWHNFKRTDQNWLAHARSPNLHVQGRTLLRWRCSFIAQLIVLIKANHPPVHQIVEDSSPSWVRPPPRGTTDAAEKSPHFAGLTSGTGFLQKYLVAHSCGTPAMDLFDKEVGLNNNVSSWKHVLFYCFNWKIPRRLFIIRIAVCVAGSHHTFLERWNLMSSDNISEYKRQLKNNEIKP